MDFRADGNADGMEQLISETIDKYAKNGIPLTRQEAMDEIAADYAANELMTDPESIQAFVNSKPKAARSFWQKLRNAFKQLRKKIDGTSAAEKKILRRMSTAEQLWADAFQAASERANGAQRTSGKRVKTKARKQETTKSLTEKSRKNMRYSAKKKTADSGSLYDYTKSFAQQIDDWMKGKIPKNDSLLIGKTPAIFQKIGFNALPMTINQTHVDYAINGTKNADHMIGADGLKQLPQALEHPVAVIASQTQGDTSVVALLPFTHNGNTVIAPVVIDGFARQNNVLIDSNAVTSVHGRKNAVTRLLADALDDYANGETSLFYWDKEKATTLLRKARVTMPKSSVQIHSGYIASIRDANSPVKPKMENVTESVQFKRWFGNWIENPEKASKIVNADGSPKIMYHQTDADFSVFRTESTGAGRGDAILPDGAFFKSSDTDIGVSGQKQMQVYLNVRNPLRLKDRASAQAYWEKHVAGYKELMQESQRTDALYNMRMEQAEAEEDAQYAKLWQQWRNGEISEEQYQSGIEEDVSEKILQEWKQEEQRITQQAKQLLNDYMHNSKYDGIILAQDEGSFGRSTDSVIAFSPNQVKSATDNVGTFDRKNADIRYSAKKKAAKNGNYDFKKSFAQQLNDWVSGRFPKGDALVLGDTPEVLQKIGLDNLPLTINQKHIDYAINGTKNAEHTIGMDMLKQLPEALKEPIAIIASETHPDTSVIALLSLVHQGHQIIAPIYINGKSRQNGAIIDTNLAASVHGRRNAITRLLANAVEKESNGNTAIFYWNKEKANALLQQARDTMPKSTALMPQVRTASAAAANVSDGYVHSIYDEGSPVKARYSIMKSRSAQSYESEIERLKKQREYISKFPTHIHDKKPTESNQSAFNVLLCISNDHSRCNGWCNTSY